MNVELCPTCGAYWQCDCATLPEARRRVQDFITRDAETELALERAAAQIRPAFEAAVDRSVEDFIAGKSTLFGVPVAVETVSETFYKETSPAPPEAFDPYDVEPDPTTDAYWHSFRREV